MRVLGVIAIVITHHFSLILHASSVCCLSASDNHSLCSYPIKPIIFKLCIPQSIYMMPGVESILGNINDCENNLWFACWSQFVTSLTVCSEHHGQLTIILQSQASVSPQTSGWLSMILRQDSNSVIMSRKPGFLSSNDSMLPLNFKTKTRRHKETICCIVLVQRSEASNG